MNEEQKKLVIEYSKLTKEFAEFRGKNVFQKNQIVKKLQDTHQILSSYTENLATQIVFRNVDTDKIDAKFDNDTADNLKFRGDK